MSEEKPDSGAFWKASSQEDWLKIREQFRESEIARDAAARETFASAAHAERLKAIEHLQFYGQTTVRMLFLLNAVSIVALLAFLGALYSKGDPTILAIAKVLSLSTLKAMPWFVAGIACTVLTSASAYFNWGGVSAQSTGPDDLFAFLSFRKSADKPKWLNPFVTGTSALSVALALVALGCWVAGCYRVARAFVRFAGA